jgi:hypothetical protein
MQTPSNPVRSYNPARIVLSIPDVPVSPNGPKGYLRMHWAKRAKYNEAWAWRIRGAMGWPAVFDQAPDMARVTIVQFRKRLLDEDNLWASCKCLLDGLVDWELIADDSPDHIELTVRQEVAKETHTEIEIETKCLTPAARP